MREAPPPATPIVERAAPTDPQTLLNAYMKRGYVLIGSSFFNTGRDEPEDAALRQGKEVGADLVLITNPRYTGSVTTAVPITIPTRSTSYTTGNATAYGAGGVINAYGNSTTTTLGSTTSFVPVTINRSDYGAAYFVKQRFPVGVFTRDLNDSERQEFQTNKGVVLTMVVDNTPAFAADLLNNDRITAVDGNEVLNSTGFFALMRERAGKKVVLSVVRRGERLEKIVQTGV